MRNWVKLSQLENHCYEEHCYEWAFLVRVRKTKMLREMQIVEAQLEASEEMRLYQELGCRISVLDSGTEASCTLPEVETCQDSTALRLWDGCCSVCSHLQWQRVEGYEKMCSLSKR